MLNQLKAQADNHGFPCPNCNHKIKASIEQILTGSSIFCGGCGLRLDIDRQSSAPAIEALKTLNQAVGQAEAELAKAKKPGAKRQA
jgi:transcription elongation factor Elf1